MKYNNFEKHISESFLHDSAAVDTDALIASLGIPVATEPKRKLAWWMLAGLALLSLLSIGLFYAMNFSGSNTQVSSVSTLELSENNNNNNESAIAAVQADDMLKEDQEVEIVSGNEQAIQQNEEAFIKQNLSQKSITEGLAKVSVQRRNENTNNENEFTRIQNSKSATTSAQLSANELTTATVVEHYTLAKIESPTPITEVQESKLEQRKLIGSLNPINHLGSELVSQYELPGLSEPECPSFSYRVPWNIALLAEVGLMKPMKDLENVGAANPIFDLRESNESSQEAIQIGLHAKVSKGANPLYVRGGLAYTRISEQMKEEYDYIELDTMRGLISITTSMTGDTVTAIYGDVVSETRYSGKSEKHYFLHLLDIPVAIGYEMPIFGSFYAGIEAGVQLNIRTSGSGLIFRDVNDYADLSEVSSKETKVGLSYFGGLHFGKHISKRSSIQLSARFRYYPNRFSTLDSTIEQRYNLAGIHAGYVYRF